MQSTGIFELATAASSRTSLLQVVCNYVASSSSNLSPYQVALRLIQIALLWLAFHLIHKGFFHPLSRYPGPFLAKFTALYAGYHGWKGDVHLDMWRCHEKYGEFVRYTPNSLSINTAESLRDIFVQGKNFKKSLNYKVMVHQAPNTLTLRDKVEHGRRRKVISQGLSDSAMRQYEPSMKILIGRFCNRLLQTVEEDGQRYNANEWQAARNMSHWCNYLAFDIMADVTFGGTYNLLERHTYRYVVDCIETSNIRVSAILQAPELQFCRLDRLLFPKSIYARDLFIRFVGKLLRDAAKVDHVAKKDIFGHLSEMKNAETGPVLNQEEIISESTTLIVAGADTASTATSALLFYLSRHPTAYAKAMYEVRSTFKSVDEIRLGAKLNSCTYLRACIDETLRKTPSVGISLAREVQEGGATVDGHFIPAGCDVGTPIYSIHHNPKYFPDPFKFNPDRWIIGNGDTTRESLDRMLSAYQPFSLGSRSCVGKGMALVEVTLTVAILLWKLDFKVAEGCTSGGHPGAENGRHRPNEFQVWDHMTAAKNGPMLHFRERQD